MSNPRFLKTAKRWMNEKVPSEKTQPVTPIQQNPPLMNNVNYSFLEGTEGQSILEEYNQLVQSEYQNTSVLQKLSFEDNVVKGSNPFMFVLLNKVLQNHGKWIARPVDLERALEKEAIDLSGTYGDSGLVLRSNGNPNEYLTKNLVSQVKEKGYKHFGGDAVMIPLLGLDLKYDSNSPHNLVFQLTDFSEIISAPQLNKTNHSEKFNRADEQGLPIFEDGGSRSLYSNQEEGLCRLYRNGDHGLFARNSVFADSGSDGRVMVCAGGTSPKN